GLLFLDRLQRDSCLHFRAEAPPLPRFHFCSLSEAAILHLNEWSEFWGALQTAPNPSASFLLSSSTSLARDIATTLDPQTESRFLIIIGSYAASSGICKSRRIKSVEGSYHGDGLLTCSKLSASPKTSIDGSSASRRLMALRIIGASSAISRRTQFVWFTFVLISLILAWKAFVDPLSVSASFLRQELSARLSAVPL